MTIIHLFKRQLGDEAVTTRKMLGQIPEDKFTWQPHPKSMTIEQLSNHMVDLPSWIGTILPVDELDLKKSGYKPTTFRDIQSLLNTFEAGLEDANKHFDKASDDILPEKWILRDGDMIYMSSTKGEMIQHVISQLIHHRAQLGVYLRLLNVPIPGSYGPSADEAYFSAEAKVQ